MTLLYSKLPLTLVNFSVNTLMCKKHLFPLICSAIFPDNDDKSCQLIFLQGTILQKMLKVFFFPFDCSLQEFSIQIFIKNHNESTMGSLKKFIVEKNVLHE